MAKTTIELPEVIHRKLRVKAALENSSMNDIVVAALKGYLHNFRIEPGMLEVDTVSKGNQRQPVSSKEG
jgi:plasmid stability protein